MHYIKNFKSIEDAEQYNEKIHGACVCLINKKIPKYKLDNMTKDTPIYFWKDDNGQEYCGRPAVVLGREGFGLGNKI